MYYIQNEESVDMLHTVIQGSPGTGKTVLAKIIAKHLDKKLLYKMVDFHSSRPGHDLRYALSGEKLKKMGWVPKKNAEKRLKQTVDWTIVNKDWL